MSEQFTDSYPEIQKIQFSRFDIGIHNPGEYVSYINDATMPEFIAYGYEGTPIRKSQAWHMRTPESEAVELHASIECDALVVDNGNWKQGTLHGLASRFIEQGLFVKMADHDTDCLYVSHPNEYRAFSVRGGNKIDQSYLSIESLPQTVLHNELGNTIQYPPNTDPTLTMSELENFLLIWGTAQDFLAEHFNSNSQVSPADREQIFVGKPAVVDSNSVPDAPSIHHESELLEHESQDPFDAIGGMFEAKRTLQQYIKRFQNPELAAQLNVPIPGFILQGPPGTGKTTLMEAFAASTGAEFRRVTSSEIQNEYIGKTSRNMEEIFNHAFASPKPVVLCFDEIDRYLQADNHREFQNAAKTFGIKIEEATQYPHVLVVAAMNSTPDQLLSSTVRSGRMKVIEIPAPNHAELADIWRAQLVQNMQVHYTDPRTNAATPLFAPPETTMLDESTSDNYDVIQLGEQSRGMTGADINQVFATLREAVFDSIINNGSFTQIHPHDILLALRHYREHDFRPNTDLS